MIHFLLTQDVTFLKNVRKKEKLSAYYSQFSLNKGREGQKQARAPKAQPEACSQAHRKEDPGGKEEQLSE